MLTPPVLISLLVFVFVTALAGVGAMLYREYAGSRTLDERLDRLTGQKTPTLEAAGILKEPMFHDDGRSVADRFLPQMPNMQRLFEQADFKMPPSQFWTLSLVLAVSGAIIPTIFGMPIWMFLFTGGTLGILPMAYVMFLRKRRLGKFAGQLSEALELVARALRAGHSLAAGMHVVAEEMPQPVAGEFGRVWEEQNLGISIEQAMRNLAERVPNLDLKFFVTAVIIQRTTGGDLAEILDKIGYVIRERFKIMGMVQALTGEGRISGIILIALPFGLLLLMLNISPTYVSLLWTHPLGRQMSIFGIIMMILGALLIRKIVNIKV